ncbi:MAG: hypothetical protein M3Q79_00870 [bacterium]|nr:hypothetical protein [bacterium]
MTKQNIHPYNVADKTADENSANAFLPGGNWQPDLLGKATREPGIATDARGEAVLPPLNVQSQVYGLELRYVGDSPSDQLVRNTVQTNAAPNVREIA